MTTAHKPTWNQALAGATQGGVRLSGMSSRVAVRDMPGEQTLKYRRVEEKTTADFGSQLEAALASIKTAEARVNTSLSVQNTLAKLKDFVSPFPQDDDDDGDASDSDEDAELRRELERIKSEREEEERIKEKARTLEAKEASREEILLGNPLIDEDLTLKKSWEDDVVFKNQGKKASNLQPRFINDTVRSDFHKRFLSKFIN
ncbi:MAG: uncharacterized protein KVP18_000604 [Porospora cf. gigantea A]|uniref:uncharacterized protein n=1 Tax=Porospora cf. gigantea A TaxID=2853593 RepID=UPI003559FFD4|nr:MAG: hypothetical protein KVP18_000604 [Porospora cf. gigantea A]